MKIEEIYEESLNYDFFDKNIIDDILGWFGLMRRKRALNIAKKYTNYAIKYYYMKENLSKKLDYYKTLLNK